MPGSDPRGSEGLARAFDGLIGQWRVHNRMLRERLVGSTDWMEFPAVSHVEPILGGLGNIDRFEAELGGIPFLGFTVRLFDPLCESWSLRWADSRSLAAGRGGMEPAFTGGFDAKGVGMFRATLEVDGHAVHARFRWSGIRAGSPAWEQAWATDPAGPWETNWTMAFRPRS